MVAHNIFRVLFVVVGEACCVGVVDVRADGRDGRLPPVSPRSCPGADGPRSEGGKRILLHNSRVYVRFLPFVSGRFHLVRLNDREVRQGLR